jgi:hypothetical protein
MLTKRIMTITVTLLVVGICIAAIAMHQFLVRIRKGRDYPVGTSDFNETGAYQIDSSKTLIDLNNGVNDILTPVSYESSLESSGNDSQVKWSFSDYLKVANVVKLQTWNDEMKDWSIYRMIFTTSCSDSAVGFSTGDFIFFRPTATETGNMYEVREISISPLHDSVEWGAGNYYPKPLFGWSEIDLDKIISADDALQIAENNGGKIARLEVNNVCDIFLSYNPNINSDNWILAMSHYNQLPNIFKIEINP